MVWYWFLSLVYKYKIYYKRQIINQRQMIQNLPLTILHFNDSYNIEPTTKGPHGPPTGGFLNFLAYVQLLKKKYPNSLVIFSGDAFAPSKLTKIKKGMQMVHCLNHLGIDIACFGNHEFDFAYSWVLSLVDQCNFKWIISNAKIKIRQGDKKKQNKKQQQFQLQNLGRGQQYHIIERQGKRIGFMGLVGPDFRSRLISQYKQVVVYENHIQCAKRVSKKLIEMGCNMIIALTHMRVPPDEQLAKNVPQIDLILGGHDHIVLSKLVNKIPLLKSGKDFNNIGIYTIEELSIKINIQKDQQVYQGRRWKFITKCVPVDTADQKIRHKYKELEQYISDMVTQYKERGVTKPALKQDKKISKQKQMHQSQWKFIYGESGAKPTLKIQSNCMSQICFARYIAFKKSVFFIPSLQQQLWFLKNKMESKKNQILQTLQFISHEILQTIDCKQGFSNNDFSCTAVYGPGIPFIPYLVQSCNILYLPSQIQCYANSAKQLSEMVQQARKKGVKCEAFPYQNNSSNKDKFTFIVKFLSLPQIYLDVLIKGKINNVIFLTCLQSNNTLQIKFKIHNMNSQQRTKNVQKQQQQHKQIKQTQILTNNNDILLIKHFNILEICLPFAQFIYNCKDTHHYDQRMQIINSRFAYQLASCFICKNCQCQQYDKDKTEVQPQQQQQLHVHACQQKIVYNQFPLSNPTYELGWGYLPVLFSPSSPFYAYQMDKLVQDNINRSKKWFNICSQTYYQLQKNKNSSKQKTHPVYNYMFKQIEKTAESNRKYRQMKVKQQKQTSTILKNSKNKQTTLEWVIKYSKKSYRNTKFIKFDEIVPILVKINQKLRQTNGNLEQKQN